MGMIQSTGHEIALERSQLFSAAIAPFIVLRITFSSLVPPQPPLAVQRVTRYQSLPCRPIPSTISVSEKKGTLINHYISLYSNKERKKGGFIVLYCT